MTIKYRLILIPIAIAATAYTFSGYADNTKTVTYDLTKKGHSFEAFGTMMWNSGGFTPDEIVRINALYEEARNLRIVRINHETRTGKATCINPDDPNLPYGVPFDKTYAEYLEYWKACGDGRIKQGIEPSTNDLQYMFLGSVPGEFKTGNNQLSSSRVNDYAHYLAAGAAHFNIKYEKYPKYIDLVNEADGNWSTYIDPNDYKELVKKLYSVLQADCQCENEVHISGAGVSHIDEWTHGDNYINALDQTGIDNIAQWSVHAWIWNENTNENSKTGQAAIMSAWPSWALGNVSHAIKPIMIGEYASAATRFYYNNTAIDFPKPTLNEINTAAYTVPFATRVYSNTISLIAANAGPNSKGQPPEEPYGASSVLYWQLKDYDWQGANGTGYPLLNMNIETNTPVYTSLLPLFKYVAMGSSVLLADTYQNIAEDVFSAAFYDEKNHCVTVAVVNSTSTAKVKESRLTEIINLPIASEVKLNVAKRFKQACYTLDSQCPFEVVLEDVSDLTWQYEKENNKIWFYTPNLPQHSHLTVQFCLE